MSDKGQKLINAQMFVNRALWAMTAPQESIERAEVQREAYILEQIDEAITELSLAREGYKQTRKAK